MSALGLTGSNLSRLNALQDKHHALEEEIEQEQKHPSVADFYLRKLKKKKLLLKEEIENLQDDSANA